MIKNDVKAATMSLRGPVGDFGDELGFGADKFLSALAEHNGADLTISLDSPGGVVSEGLSIYNALVQHEGVVTVHVDTIAASIATVICCAADSVVINSNAQYMVHLPWAVAMGNSVEFRGLVDQLEVLDNMLAEVYSEKTGLETEELMDMMKNETFLTAKDALSLGFADSIHEIKKNRATKNPKALAISPCVIAASAKAKSLKMRLSL